MADMVKEPMTDEEIARQRDEVVKRMLATPPQPRVNPKSREHSRERSGEG